MEVKCWNVEAHIGRVYMTHMPKDDGEEHFQCPECKVIVEVKP